MTPTIPDAALKAADNAIADAVGHTSSISTVMLASAALTASLPFLTGVKVKALKWTKGVVDIAHPHPGMKYVACSTTPKGSWAWWLDNAPETRDVFSSEEAAKSAAQADYEARILSAIEVSSVDCACTKIQQDESCPIGYPSLLCEICDGKGIAPSPRAQALEEALKLTLSVVKLQNGNLHDDINQIIAESEAALSSQPVADKKADEFVAYRFKHRNDGPHMWEYYPLPVEKSDNPDFVTQALTLKKLLAILNSDQHADRQSQPVATGGSNHGE